MRRIALVAFVLIGAVGTTACDRPVVIHIGTAIHKSSNGKVTEQ